MRLRCGSGAAQVIPGGRDLDGRLAFVCSSVCLLDRLFSADGPGRL